MRQCMKLILAFTVLALLINQCSHFDYDNKLDPEGINKGNFANNPDLYLGDDDGDGVENVIDEDHDLNKDTAAPTITIKGGLQVEIENGDKDMLDFYLEQWEAKDDGGGTITKHDPYHNVNIYKDSCYIVRYSATDEDGNTGRATRTICVVTPTQPDNDPPILTIADTILIVPLNSSYIPPQYSAYDTKDGIITEKVIIDGTVDTSVIGDYVITYSVKDVAGNEAIVKVRVTVKKTGSDIDFEIPVITLIGDDTVYVPEGVEFDDFKTTYVDPGATAYDKVDGDITSKIIVSDFTYLSPKYRYLAYNVTDNSQNNAQEVKRYFDTGLSDDLQGPIIDLYPSSDSIIEVVVDGVWIEPGFEATDVNDLNLTDSVVVDSSELVANLSKVGLYSVTYTVKNSAGIQTTVVRKVRVVDSGIDTKPPVITLLGSNPDTVLINSSATYEDPGATAEDNHDGDVTANITVMDNVDMSSLGKYTVTYRVKDAAGRASTETRTVWVVRSLLSSDILVNYGVPSEDPLPDMSNLTFAHVDIDGDGPEELMTAVKSHTINWSAKENLLRGFSFQYNANPYYKDITTGITHNFGETFPGMTIKGSLVDGLDGDYYVTYDGKEFIWVDQKGKFAIIWTK